MIGFLIAGTSSGVGKTTVSLALTAAMRRRGLDVQAFKSGPDFLDTGHHTRVSGWPARKRHARNLDTWMLSRNANLDLFHRASVGADAVIVEGMMGLFDGKDTTSDAGSSAEIARLLRLPVVLVVDAGKSGRSIAAVVLGFERFAPELPLAGVILNNVAGDGHSRMLNSAIKASCRAPVLGWLPRRSAITIPERHLGLYTAEETDDDEQHATFFNTLADLAEEHFDMASLLRLQCGLDPRSAPVPAPLCLEDQVRIGVARDRAFSFYYEDNLDLLREHGASIVLFSPLEDSRLPDNLDALYLGGGYPELHAQQLCRNSGLIADIRAFAASGRPIYAECGGMIYLSKKLTLLEGASYPLAGVIPLDMEMTPRLVDFGYVTVEL